MLIVCPLLFVGMNKMVINHLEKLFVTNDAATIIRELEVKSLLSGQKRILIHNIFTTVSVYGALHVDYD